LARLRVEKTCRKSFLAEAASRKGEAPHSKSQSRFTRIFYKREESSALKLCRAWRRVRARSPALGDLRGFRVLLQKGQRGSGSRHFTLGGEKSQSAGAQNPRGRRKVSVLRRTKKKQKASRCTEDRPHGDRDYRLKIILRSQKGTGKGGPLRVQLLLKRRYHSCAASSGGEKGEATGGWKTTNSTGGTRERGGLLGESNMSKRGRVKSQTCRTEGERIPR